MMKHLVLVVWCLGVAGCGHRPATVQVPDERRIEAVERAAARGGVTVHWMHLPQRRVPAGGG